MYECKLCGTTYERKPVECKLCGSMSIYKKQSGRGGYRPGSGRPRTGKRKASVFLAHETIDYLTEKGNGSISKGIEQLINEVS